MRNPGFLVMGAALAFFAGCSQVEVRKTPDFACSKDIELSSTATGASVNPISMPLFFETDRAVTASILCRNISGTHTVKWEWKDPNGSTYVVSEPAVLATHDISFSPAATVKHGINVTDERASTLNGEWQVRAYLDDVFFTSRRFTLARTPELFEQVKSLPSVQTNPNKFAVVIGIEKYLDTPAARFAERDAEVMSELFVRRFGVPPQNVTMLTNERVSLGVMRNLFNNKLHSLPPGSTLYVFYSGHGAPRLSDNPGEAATPYLIPYDGSPTNLKDTGFALHDLYGALDKLPVQNVFVFLDACFSGSTGRETEKKALSASTKAVEVYVKDPAVISKKVVSMASSQGSQLSNGYERERLGLFTSQLVKVLVDRKSPLSTKKTITVQELFSQLKGNVEAESRKTYGLDRQQVPDLKPASLGQRSQLAVVNNQ